MWRLGLLAAVVACSPAPAERLRDPKPVPGRCKTADQVYQVQRPVAATNEKQLAAARARFLSDHQLTRETNVALPVIEGSTYGGRDSPEDKEMGRAITAALRSQPDRDLIRIDLGRTTWSQAVLQRADAAHDPCGRDPLPPIAFELAHDANGQALVIRTRTSRRVVSSVEQCGSCTYGCGIPQNGFEYTGVLLPIATGVPYQIETLDLVEDRVQVWCEHELPAS